MRAEWPDHGHPAPAGDGGWLDDFGVRNGYRIAFGLAEMPKPKELLALGERWRPHATTAAWYLWRAADAAKEKPAIKGVNA